MAEDGSPTTTPAPSAVPLGRGVRAGVVVGVVAAMLAVGMTTTAVAITGRGVADDLGVGAGAIGWVVNTYLLVAAAFAVAGGRLGDVIGRGRTFVVGASVFAVGSVLGAAAPGISALLAAHAPCRGSGRRWCCPRRSRWW